MKATRFTYLNLRVASRIFDYHLTAVFWPKIIFRLCLISSRGPNYAGSDSFRVGRLSIERFALEPLETFENSTWITFAMTREFNGCDS